MPLGDAMVWRIALADPSFDLSVSAGIGSARAVNKRLCDFGLQQQYRDGKGHAYYEPTATGQASQHWNAGTAAALGELDHATGSVGAGPSPGWLILSR